MGSYSHHHDYYGYIKLDNLFEWFIWLHSFCDCWNRMECRAISVHRTCDNIVWPLECGTKMRNLNALAFEIWFEMRNKNTTISDVDQWFSFSVNNLRTGIQCQLVSLTLPVELDDQMVVGGCFFYRIGQFVIIRWIMWFMWKWLKKSIQCYLHALRTMSMIINLMLIFHTIKRICNKQPNARNEANWKCIEPSQCLYWIIGDLGNVPNFDINVCQINMFIPFKCGPIFHWMGTTK